MEIRNDFYLNDPLCCVEERAHPNKEKRQKKKVIGGGLKNKAKKIVRGTKRKTSHHLGHTQKRKGATAATGTGRKRGR